MTHTNQPQSPIVLRLTALWALSESGLGGFMHALKIPFTGFFLGGFAIVMIVLIAHHAAHPFRSIMQATLLVVLIKATVSPHSPPMAYIAVTFQGLVGALCFAPFGINRLAVVCFGAIALFESAIQKFLVMTLLFGESLWKALDAFFKGILKDLNLDTTQSFSFWLIATYTLVYTIWGAWLGFQANKLPPIILQQQQGILEAYQQLPTLQSQSNTASAKSRYKKWLSFAFILLFIVTVFVFQGAGGKALYAVIRTVAVLLLLLYVVNPVVQFGLRKWLSGKQQQHQQTVTEILGLLPEMKNRVTPAMHLARAQNKGLRVYKAFVVNLIVLALFAPNESK